MGTTFPLDVSQQALIGAGIILWLIAAAFVAYRSPLRTYLRIIDAFVLPPLAAAALVAGVWSAERLLPWMRQLWARPDIGVAARLGSIGHETLTIVTAILVAAVGPVLLLWVYRRKLQHKEDDIQSRRAERANIALERGRAA